MSYNIFILCHYGGTIIPDVNSTITYNSRSSFLLYGNLGMSCVEMKKTIWHGLGW
jgi:hypothetical protein